MSLNDKQVLCVYVQYLLYMESLELIQSFGKVYVTENLANCMCQKRLILFNYTSVLASFF